MDASTEQRTAVPRVTLYVRDADTPTWDRARALLEGDDENSLSSLVTEALLALVERRERERKAETELRDSMETIELSGLDWRNRELPRRLRFTGVFVHEDGTAAFYLTQAKKIVMEVSEAGETLLHVFDDFYDFREAAERLQIVERAIQPVAEALGVEHFEEIE